MKNSTFLKPELFSVQMKEDYVLLRDYCLTIKSDAY